MSGKADIAEADIAGYVSGYVSGSVARPAVQDCRGRKIDVVEGRYCGR